MNLPITNPWQSARPSQARMRARPRLRSKKNAKVQMKSKAEEWWLSMRESSRLAWAFWDGNSRKVPSHLPSVETTYSNNTCTIWITSTATRRCQDSAHRLAATSNKAVFATKTYPPSSKQVHRTPSLHPRSSHKSLDSTFQLWSRAGQICPFLRKNSSIGTNSMSLNILTWRRLIFSSERRRVRSDMKRRSINKSWGLRARTSTIAFSDRLCPRGY